MLRSLVGSEMCIRDRNQGLGRGVEILGDLQGPKIRTTEASGGRVKLTQGEVWEFGLQRNELDITRDGRITLARTHEQDILVRSLELDSVVMLHDGFLRIKVVGRESQDQLKCVVEVGGELRSRQGVNIPGLKLGFSSLTEKDKVDLRFFLQQEVDYVAISFVQTASDVEDLIREMAECGVPPERFPKIICKIEKEEAVRNIAEILDKCDGLMIARGDMGVEMGLENVPFVQKYLTRMCVTAGKMCICATQMLMGCVNNPIPTRADVDDVANAIIDGCTAVMLSDEMAKGKFPAEAVKWMSQIASFTEASISPDGKHRLAPLEALAYLDQQYRPPQEVQFTLRDDRRARVHLEGRSNACPEGAASESTAPQAPQSMTRKRMVIMIKPDVSQNQEIVNLILNELRASGFEFIQVRTAHLSPEEAGAFYMPMVEKPWYQQIVRFISSGPVLLIDAEAQDALRAWIPLCRQLRANYGRNRGQNAVHGSRTKFQAILERRIAFPSNVQIQRTMAIIKPDAVAAGHTDAILRSIADAGLSVVARKDVYRSAQECGVFYAEHRHRRNYTEMTEFNSSGYSVVLCLEGPDAIEAWRIEVGPSAWEVEYSAPGQGLRSRYGMDGIRNAVHGSDSESAAAWEISHFFPDLAPLEH
eukprot:TRINITY_DN10755_c0_g2_i3.p1 TRINITY_DN10755_c0_g2~~TRINITY_DN10755_c0_g2_i3.p1  ORF type:complete len:646 (+),score=125.82 TRINITY_DN10755_c0_g2_i3:159-2096(+)